MAHSMSGSSNILSASVAAGGNTTGDAGDWILAVESSCDESALAYFCPVSGRLRDWIFSQTSMHSDYGGVVPDLASREHVSRFPALLGELMAYAREHSAAAPARIAVTVGPGLAGCLAIGLGVAKSLALALNRPLVGINHLRGHAFSPFIPVQRQRLADFPAALDELLPHLGLIVSGGNTLLFAIEQDVHLRIIGQTVDDAAGEALDKGAKLLGMSYPGGARIEKAARVGVLGRHEFPAFAVAGEQRFSFSGLKTSLRYRLEKMSDSELARELPHLCASYQEAVVRQLVDRSHQALGAGIFKSFGLSGGVSNNALLRSRMADLASSHGAQFLAAEPGHTGDNAAMIAFAAWLDPDTANRQDGLSMPFRPAGLAGFDDCNV